MAKALWLNERPERARRMAEKPLALRPDFAEVHLLLGSIEYDESAASSAADPTVKWRKAQVTRKQYETALAFPDLPPGLRAEALFKMGMVSADLENKKEAVRP